MAVEKSRYGVCDKPGMVFGQNSEGDKISTTVVKVNKTSQLYFIGEDEYNRLKFQSNMLSAVGGVSFVATFYTLVYHLVSERQDLVTIISIMALITNGMFFMGLGAGHSITLSRAEKYDHAKLT